MKDFENTLMNTLGIEIINSDDNRIVAKMPVNDRTCQIYGMLHGGASIALAESVAGYGDYIRIDKSQIAVGINVTANHVNPAKMGDTVTATGTIISEHKSVHVWNVDIRNSSGTLISTVRITNHISRKKV
jgi:uncharacterized protein (TIGR00369 family)